MIKNGVFEFLGTLFSDITRQSKPKLALGVTYNVNENAVRQQGQLGKFVRFIDTAGIPSSDYAQNTLYAFQADMIFF